MTEQSQKIKVTTGFIKKHLPAGFKPGIAIILENNFNVLSDFTIKRKLNYRLLPEVYGKKSKDTGSILFARCGSKDVIILEGRSHYFDGTSMREIGHMIYVLRFLGVKKILSIDETGHLNPRFKCGELALIYDHINLIGDNPLIGENDNELGLRFPDMSNAYDKDLFNSISGIFLDRKLKIYESVYLGITGPQTETDAEARFYREIGADILGYSIVPENIAAVHAGVNFAAIGLITRELVADKMMEDNRSEAKKEKDQRENLKLASKKLEKVLKSIIDKF